MNLQYLRTESSHSHVKLWQIICKHRTLSYYIRHKPHVLTFFTITLVDSLHYFWKNIKEYHIKHIHRRKCQQLRSRPTFKTPIFSKRKSSNFLFWMSRGIIKVLLGKSSHSRPYWKRFSGSYLVLTRPGPYLNEWGESCISIFRDLRGIKNTCLKSRWKTD